MHARQASKAAQGSAHPTTLEPENVYVTITWPSQTTLTQAKKKGLLRTLFSKTLSDDIKEDFSQSLFIRTFLSTLVRTSLQELS